MRSLFDEGSSRVEDGEARLRKRREAKLAAELYGELVARKQSHALLTRLAGRARTKHRLFSLKAGRLTWANLERNESGTTAVRRNSASPA